MLKRGVINNNGAPPPKTMASEQPTIESVLKYLADGGDYKDLSAEEMSIYANYSKQKEEITKQKHMERMKEINRLWQQYGMDVYFELSPYEQDAFANWRKEQQAGTQGRMNQTGGSAFSFTRLFSSSRKQKRGSKRKSSTSRKSKRTQKRC